MQIEILSSEGRCPVCGTEGTNCAGESGAPDHITPRETEVTGGPFVVQEHVYRQVPISAKRMTTLLRFHKGQVISMAEAKREGLIEQAEEGH